MAQVSRGLPQSLKENLVYQQLGHDGIFLYSFPYIDSPSHHMTLLKTSLNQGYILEINQTENYHKLHLLALTGLVANLFPQAN
jgi:hypothetical protein